MTIRTLAEAAMDVLNKSRSDSLKMPMEKLATVRGTAGLAGQEDVVDLGGATYDNPEGPEIGKITAAHRGTATPPGVQPDADKKAPMEKLEDGDSGNPENKRPSSKDAAKVSLQKAGEVSDPEEHNAAHSAEHGEYAHPTMEETELTEEEIEEARQERWENAKAKLKEFSVREDIDAMFGDEVLSEDFKTKAETIFEAAVISRALLVAEALEEEILDAAQQAVEDAQVEMEEQIDTYLNYTVKNWVEENQVAIETGLRSEIVEDFISGMKNLFAEHYIDVPAEKVDVVESQAAAIADLNDKINEVLNANAELSKKLDESNKQIILATVSEGLTATQAAKVKTLAEGVEFTTESEYAKKLQTIKESYFNGGSKVSVKTGSSNGVLSEEQTGPAQIEELDSPIMASYVAALNRTQVS